MCPIGSVAKWFVEFCIIVAKVFGLSSVQTPIKLKVVQNLVKKMSVWNRRKELILLCSRKMEIIVVFYWEVCNPGRIRFQTYLCYRIDSVNIQIYETNG